MLGNQALRLTHADGPGISRIFSVIHRLSILIQRFVCSGVFLRCLLPEPHIKRKSVNDLIRRNILECRFDPILRKAQRCICSGAAALIMLCVAHDRDIICHHALLPEIIPAPSAGIIINRKYQSCFPACNRKLPDKLKIMGRTVLSDTLEIQIDPVKSCFRRCRQKLVDHAFPRRRGGKQRQIIHIGIKIIDQCPDLNSLFMGLCHIGSIRQRIQGPHMIRHRKPGGRKHIDPLGIFQIQRQLFIVRR